jgi:hypothetical protein
MTLKPNPKDFGYVEPVPALGEEGGWLYEGGQEKHEEALAKWEQKEEEIRKEISERTRLAIADFQRAIEEHNEPISHEMAAERVKRWKGWYLKKNQPYNYIRVTRQIPPDCIEREGAWRHSLQLWVKRKKQGRKIIEEYAITKETYEYYAIKWGEIQDKSISYAKLWQ